MIKLDLEPVEEAPRVSLDLEPVEEALNSAPVGSLDLEAVDSVEPASTEPNNSSTRDFLATGALGVATNVSNALAGAARFARMPGVADEIDAMTGTFKQASTGQLPNDNTVDPGYAGTTGAKVARAGAGLVTIAPAVASGAVAGPVAGFSAMGAQSLAEAKGAAYEATKAEGKTDEEASKVSNRAAAVAAAMLPVYLAGGKLATSAVKKMMAEESPVIAQAVVTTLVNAGVNMVASAGARGINAKVEGKPVLEAMKPDIENIIPDLAFAGHSGLQVKMSGGIPRGPKPVVEEPASPVEPLSPADLRAAGLTQTADVVEAAKTSTTPAEAPPVEPSPVPTVETPRVIPRPFNLVVEDPTAPRVEPPVDATAERPISPPVDPAAPAEQPAAMPTAETPVEGVVAPEAAKRANDPTPDQTATSIRNAQVDKERAAHGLPPAMEPARRSFGTVWDEAMREVESDPNRTAALVDSLRENPRSLTDLEDALLLHRQVELQNSYEKAARELNEAYDSPDPTVRTEAKLKADSLLTQLQDIYDVGKKVGTENARGLNARKMAAAEDYTLASMAVRRQAAKGGEPLTPKETAEVQAQHAEIQRTEKALTEREMAAEEAAATKAADEAVAEITAEVKAEKPVRAPKPAPASSTPSKTQKVLSFIDQQAEAARKRIQARRSELNAFGVIPDLYDRSVIGASYLARGVVDFATWSSKMIEELGNDAKEDLDQLFKHSKAYLDSQSNAAAANERAVILADTIAARSAEGASMKDLQPMIRKLAKEFIRSGVTQRDPMVDSVHSVLAGMIPGINRTHTRDLISGYGQFKLLSKDEVDVILRDNAGQLQQIAKLEDMQARRAPKKTGVEQREPSATERDLIKQVNEMKKKGGFNVTDPEKQLKTSMDSIKTRLRNEIEDIGRAIDRREELPRKTGSIEYDAEAKALREQRDALKAEYDAIFQKPDLTDAQRMEMAIKAAERSVKGYEQLIKEGRHSRPGRPKLTSPELEAVKARRDALKAEVEALRDADGAFQEAKAQAYLEKSVSDLEKRISNGDLLPPSGRAPVRGLNLEVLRFKREQLRKELADLREQAGIGSTERNARTAGALERSIAEYTRRLDEADFSDATVAAGKPVPPEVEALRAERDFMKEAYRAAKAEQKPRKTADEIALAALKARLLKQTAQLQDKLARGDFSKKTKREIPLDPETTRAKFDHDVAKQAYLEGNLKHMLANQTAPEKALRYAAEVFNTSRAIMTSADFSAVLRQGGFIGIANPVRSAKALPVMFKAFGLTPKSSLMAMKAAGKELLKGSPKQAYLEGAKTIKEYGERMQHAVNEEIASRPNANLYKQAKLYLSEDGALNLGKMEEAYMSRFANHIPLVAGSARAYSTFLNRLRADSFDAMAATLSKNGKVTPVEAKAIANFINVATGRGSFGMRTDAAQGLSAIFFAPRYVASRFQLLAGQPFYGGNARTRGLIAKEYAKFLLGVGAIYGIGSQFTDEKLETDPRSSNFGKMRFGNAHIEFGAGLLQNTVLLSRLATGETKQRGKIIPIRGEKVPFGGKTSADIIGSFLRTKLSPIVGAGVNVVDEKDVIGKPTTLSNEAMKMVVPITVRDIYAALVDDGVNPQDALGLVSIFGGGYQYYDEQKPKSGR